MLKNNKDNSNKVINKTKKGNKLSLKKTGLTAGMIKVIFFCWLVPYIGLSIVLFLYSNSQTENKIKQTITASNQNAANVSISYFEKAFEESLEASYDGVIKESYLEYKETGDKELLVDKCNEYLKNTYSYSNVISNVHVIFKFPTRTCYTYSNIAGSSYRDIDEYKTITRYAVNKVSKNLGTESAWVYVANHLYLVRNLVDNKYRTYATLVMEVSMDKLFESVQNVVWFEDCQIYLDNNQIYSNESISTKTATKLRNYYENNLSDMNVQGTVESINDFDESQMIGYYIFNYGNQKISFVVKIDKSEIINQKYTFVFLYLVIAILLIPLISATVYYFYNNVNKPINKLIRASEKIENGEFGYQIETFDKNYEFKKLIKIFNQMSVGLQESFNKIYTEEIATRDAKLKALQSQINPHFLNNTLEIINWKVRMNGDIEASKMIESLGIMMEATMNRSGEQYVSIKEEMRYVDAYLYIIKNRFREKFSFEKEVDEDLYDINIPKLIIQPIIENAVDHGGDKFGNRIGKLTIRREDNLLYIIVENNGELTNEDRDKIDKLLSGKEEGSKLGNIGIRNVNLRLKMLYGEECGLTITNKNSDKTVSEIIIDLSKNV